MIRLVKGAEPNILVQKGAAWTAEYLAALGTASEKQKEKWRHRQIKESLSTDTGGRCSYCEGKVNDVAFGHVDHIRPKKKFAELAHMWTNLTWACPVCNGNKGDYWDDHEPLLDPYQDAIEDHLIHLGSLVDWQVGDVRAEMTVETIGLNRLDIADARRQRLIDVKAMLERWHAASGRHKELLAHAIRLDAERGEFSGTVRAYLVAHSFPQEVPTDEVHP